MHLYAFNICSFISAKHNSFKRSASNRTNSYCFKYSADKSTINEVHRHLNNAKQHIDININSNLMANVMYYTE